MKNKIILPFFLLCLSMNFVHAETMYDGFKGNEWKFIEYMFIKKNKEESNTTAKAIKQFGIITLASFLINELAKSYCNIRISEKYKRFIEVLPNEDAALKKEFLRHGMDMIFMFIPIIFANSAYNSWYSNAIEYENCSKFIANWPDYKELTPSELHNSFETLYQKYLCKKLKDNEIYEMIKVIKELLSFNRSER